MRRPSTRLAAGTLVLALPLAAAAGCGAEKKRTIKAEFASAQSNLEKSSSTSLTLRFDDAKGAVKALAKKDGSVPDGVLDDLLKASLTVTADPAGQSTFGALSKGCTPGAAAPKLEESLNRSNLSILVKDATSDLGEIRLVQGTLYVHVNLTEIGRLAKAGGAEDFDTSLDDAAASADPKLAAVLTDVRAGKWIKLPIAKYLTQLQSFAESFAAGMGEKIPSTPAEKAKACSDYSKVGSDLFTAVKPYIKVTDANDSSSDRVLDVNIAMRPALKAGLGVLKASDALPVSLSKALKSVEPSDVDDAISDGNAHGTITLKSGHLTQVTVDVESVRKLDPQAGKDSLAGASVVFDIDDSAGEVKAPTDLSSFDLGAVLDDLLKGFGEGFAGSGQVTG